MKTGSLFRRLLPPLGGAVAVLTLAVTSVGAILMRKAVIDHAQYRAETLAPAIRDQIGLVMEVGDHRHLAAVVAELGHNPDISVIRVLRPNGVIHASSRPSEVGSAAPEHLQQVSDLGDYRSPALWNGAVIHSVARFSNAPACHACHGREARLLGLLDVDVAVNPHLTGLTAFGSLSLILGFFYFLAVVGIAVPTLGYVVVHPLRRLIAGLHRVERGDLDTTLAHTGTQEIDEVVDGFNRMVAELREAHISEKQKRRLEQERAEQLASVGQLATGLAHEFRNPLSSVKAVVEVLAAEARRDEGRRDILRAAAGELDRMDQILKDLLQYARPRLPDAARCDLNSLVAELTGLLMPAGNGKPPVFLETEQGLPEVLADPSMVRQVVTNLLLNAEQAQGGLDAPRIVVRTGRTGTHAWCRIKDDGPGVPADRAQSIFHPFTTTKPRGTGLGLAISRRVVEMQGGRLALDNPGEPGASFSFTLPLAPPPAS